MKECAISPTSHHMRWRLWPYRCPVNLKAENLEAWLAPEGRETQTLQAILSDPPSLYYTHAAVKAA